MVGFAMVLACTSGCGPSEPDSNTGFNLPTPTAPFTASPTPTATPINQGTATPTRGVHQVVVRVRGTTDAKFRGQLSDATSNRSVDGTIPAEFTFMNARTFVSASFNITDTGRKELAVQIYSDGMLKSEQSTTAEFASVSLSATLDQ